MVHIKPAISPCASCLLVACFIQWLQTLITQCRSLWLFTRHVYKRALILWTLSLYCFFTHLDLWVTLKKRKSKTGLELWTTLHSGEVMAPVLNLVVIIITKCTTASLFIEYVQIGQIRWLYHISITKYFAWTSENIWQ